MGDVVEKVVSTTAANEGAVVYNMVTITVASYVGAYIALAVGRKQAARLLEVTANVVMLIWAARTIIQGVGVVREVLALIKFR